VAAGEVLDGSARRPVSDEPGRLPQPAGRMERGHDDAAHTDRVVCAASPGAAGWTGGAGYSEVPGVSATGPPWRDAMRPRALMTLLMTMS